MPLIPKTNARHLVAVPGLSSYDAACYLAGVGTIDRFRHAGQVWALAGFEPQLAGSGDYPDRVGCISKQGDPLFRDTLFQMGYRVAQHYAPVGLTFINTLERGKSKVEAIIHVAHRVNRICFHLMQHDEPFENRTTPELDAERAVRWEKFKTTSRQHSRPQGKRNRRR